MVEARTQEHKELGSTIGVMIINMEGERDLSLHEPIGIEVVASAVKQAVPGAAVEVFDVQPQLIATGKVDTDALANRVRAFAKDEQRPVLLGLGVPIYSWEYAKSLLIKLEQDPPESPITVVLGNAIPTYTKPDLIKREFPYVKLVAGEGEETFARMAQSLARGEEVQEQERYFEPPNLENYAMPLRLLTQDIIHLGGSVKVEGSRGCGHAACTFCSRQVRGGKDYRTIPEEYVVRQVQELLDTFNVDHFEFTDEEAFDNNEATARLISAFKSANMPRIPFVGSMRVDTILKLQDGGLLDQLHEIGLQKVFLGVEGGSDAYLKQVAKGQTVADVREAMRLVHETGMDMEIGFIMFSWRMSFDMLKENIEFLSQGNTVDYVSSLFNFLAVRAGTLDEVLLKRYVAQGKITNYDPDAHFSVNLSYYQDVPFMDERVGKIFHEAQEFAQADEKLYYVLKSLVRAGTLPQEAQAKAVDIYLRMKDLHLAYFQNAVGIKTIEGIKEKRHNLVIELHDLFGDGATGDIIDLVRRETAVFLAEEVERTQSTGDQTGSLVVCVDELGRVLLVRPRDDEVWAFPGGNTKPEETIDASALRETVEELGVDESDVELVRSLPTIVKEGHHDHVTGNRPRLVLYHTLARLHGHIDIMRADHEIADTLWLYPEEIVLQKVKTRDNVHQIMEGIIENNKETFMRLRDSRQELVQWWA